MNLNRPRSFIAFVAIILLAVCTLGSAGAAVTVLFRSASFQDAAERPVQRIRVTAERFSFTPSRIKVKTGAIVEIVGESADTSHGFHLADAGIDTEIPARGKGELRLRFEAAEAGTYFFECSRPCGAGHNTMRGTIVVED
jgi:cytochrome c oxidase subunit 2